MKAADAITILREMGLNPAETMPAESKLTCEDQHLDEDDKVIPDSWTPAVETTWADFVVANGEDEDTVLSVAPLNVGDSVLLGGGAHGCVRVTRVS